MNARSLLLLLLLLPAAPAAATPEIARQMAAGELPAATLAGTATPPPERAVPVAAPAPLDEPPAGPPLSDEAEVARRTEAVSELLRCPVCQGLSAAASQAEAAVAMRTRSEELVRLGYSDAQILAFFVSRYGEWVLLEPPRQGRHWIVWLGPLLVLGLGALAVAWRMTAAAQVPAGGMASQPSTTSHEDPYERRILDELERS